MGNGKLILRGGGTKAYPIINSVGWLVAQRERGREREKGKSF